MHLISATLDNEAHRIYESWPARLKSSEIRYAIKFYAANGPQAKIGLFQTVLARDKTIVHLQKYILAMDNGEEPPESASMRDMRLEMKINPEASE